MFRFTETMKQLRAECLEARQHLTVLPVISPLTYKVKYVFHLTETRLYKYLFDVEVLRIRVETSVLVR